MVTFTVNGKEVKSQASADTPLLWVIRDEIGLKGTKFGCGVALCGACSIMLDGTVVRSCSTMVSQAIGKNITTIEGTSDSLEALRQAWRDNSVPQCGYCQSGQLISAAELLDTNDNPTDEDIDNAMSGNICRCGTYVRIKKAIKEAVELKKQA